MFNKDLEKRVEKLIESRNLSIENLGKRLNDVERQLEPKPAFEVGEHVNFFLLGQEFEGEIVRNDYDYSSYFSFLEPQKIGTMTDKWRIKYLDKNDVVQIVVVKEEDIWTEESNEITDIYDHLYELKEQIKELKSKKTK